MSALVEAAASQAAPAVASRGLTLLELSSHQCRFPIEGSGADMRFCAVEILPGDWLPGFSCGSYCRPHRIIATGHYGGTEAA
ncbi:MAG: hypothetical protein ABTQ31_10155 [Rhizobiaceae bacterium]